MCLSAHTLFWQYIRATKSITKVIIVLIKQGFWYSKLCKFFKKFVSRHNALFSKYGVSVRTHVHEGICIPLVVKHELSKRHVIGNFARAARIGEHVIQCFPRRQLSKNFPWESTCTVI